MTSPANAPAAQRQFLIAVSTVTDGYFATKSGGATEADVARVYDGGSLDGELIAAPPVTENITVGRPYRPARDSIVVQRHERGVGRLRATITITPTDPDLVPVGEATTHADCLLVGVNPPEADAGSGDPGTYELVFAVPRPPR